MFARTLTIERIDSEGIAHLCPIKWIDNFAMRNFTNDAIFDDTLPVADGLLEVGNRVPLDRLRASMEDWFRRKSYLAPGDWLRITESAAGHRQPQGNEDYALPRGRPARAAVTS